MNDTLTGSGFFRRRVLPLATLGAALLTLIACEQGGGTGGGGTPPDDGSASGGSGAGGSGAITLPSYWFDSDMDAWVGQRWDELDLFKYLRPAPTGIEEGVRYVVFYRRTCDHCQEMFEADLATMPGLASRVTAVEVPETKDVMTGANAWELPPTECELLSLPLGVDWIMTTPVTVRVNDGVVECAQEGDHKGCMELE